MHKNKHIESVRNIRYNIAGILEKRIISRMHVKFTYAQQICVAPILVLYISIDKVPDIGKRCVL